MGRTIQCSVSRLWASHSVHFGEFHCVKAGQQLVNWVLFSARVGKCVVEDAFLREYIGFLTYKVNDYMSRVHPVNCSESREVC